MEKLFEWQSSSDFSKKVALLRQVGVPEIWGREYKKLREAISACELAACMRPLALRMSEGDGDFELRTRDGRLLRVQETIALKPHRTPRLEYEKWRADLWIPRTFEGLQEDDNAAVILEQLRYRVKEKARKRYNPSTALLVYLNVGGFFVDPVEVERGMVDACSPGREHFSSIWVKWGQRHYRCWPNPWWDESADFRPNPAPLTAYSAEHRAFWEALRTR